MKKHYRARVARIGIVLGLILTLAVVSVVPTSAQNATPANNVPVNQLEVSNLTGSPPYGYHINVGQVGTITFTLTNPSATSPSDPITLTLANDRDPALGPWIDSVWTSNANGVVLQPGESFDVVMTFTMGIQDWQVNTSYFGGNGQYLMVPELKPSPSEFSTVSHLFLIGTPPPEYVPLTGSGFVPADADVGDTISLTYTLTNNLTTSLAPWYDDSGEYNPSIFFQGQMQQSPESFVTTGGSFTVTFDYVLTAENILECTTGSTTTSLPAATYTTGFFYQYPAFLSATGSTSVTCEARLTTPTVIPPPSVTVEPTIMPSSTASVDPTPTETPTQMPSVEPTPGVTITPDSTAVPTLSATTIPTPTPTPTTTPAGVSTLPLTGSAISSRPGGTVIWLIFGTAMLLAGVTLVQRQKESR